jgi:Mn-containing catalase
MLLAGVNGELKNAVERSSLGKVMNGASGRDELVHEALIDPQFLVLTGGGPALTNSAGVPWTGAYVNANGDLTVDLRSNIAAESRAKIVYEYLMQFTDDPYVKESLGFLMTREIAHFQMFTAALATIVPNFPPGVLAGDPRYTHTYFNMSDGAEVRGPWNEGSGPWTQGEWKYVQEPVEHVRETRGLLDEQPETSGMSLADAKSLDKKMSKQRSTEVNAAVSPGESQWSHYAGRAKGGSKLKK